MSIVIKISRAALWDSRDLEEISQEIDVGASETMLAEMVGMAIVAEMGEDVEVSVEDIAATEIGGIDDEEIRAEAQEIAAEVLGSREWLVNL